MKIFALVLACLPLALACAESATQHLVLHAVTLIDGRGGPPRSNVDIEIQDGRIAAIVPAAAGPASRKPRARTIDFVGHFVVPGFIDTHAHVTVLDFQRDESGSVRTEYKRDRTARALQMLLAHGVTTARNPAVPSARDGVALREALAAGRLPGPRILTAGTILGDGSFVDEQAVRAVVADEAREGVDYVKVYSGLPPAYVRTAIDEAHRHGVRVIGHLGQNPNWGAGAQMEIDALTHASSWSVLDLPPDRRSDVGKLREAGRLMLARLAWLEAVDLDSPQFRKMLRTITANRIPVDPTLVAHHSKHFGDVAEYREDPDQSLVPGISETWHEFGTFVDHWDEEDFARARRAWPTLLALVRAYHGAGILLTTGSDTPNPWVIPGISLHQEMALLASAGISPVEVIRMATRNGAESLGLLNEIGTVELGKRADLVVLTADPLADIRNTRSIRHVIQAGRLLEPDAILAEPQITDW